MQSAVQPIIQEMAKLEFAPPVFPIAENVSGTLVTDAEELRALLVRHVISPVRWQEDVQALAAAGATRFVECGPGDALTKMAKRLVPGATAVAVGTPEAAVTAVSSAP
jgi:[acyl-carrier-protein] S-malonyltransferase